MIVQEFISALENHKDLPLVVENPNDFRVRSDFHITEIKTLQIDSVDCGGQFNEWEETLVQLWEPQQTDPNHLLTTTKALEIIQRVDAVKPLKRDTELKIEYTGEKGVLSIYHLSDYKLVNGTFNVSLSPEKADCKAIGRGETCGPKEKVKLDLATIDNSCEPGSGCCN